MQEKYISQIQDLLESNDSENINLAFQLMEGLDLQKEVLSLYGIKDWDSINEVLIYKKYNDLIFLRDILIPKLPSSRGLNHQQRTFLYIFNVLSLNIIKDWRSEKLLEGYINVLQFYKTYSRINAINIIRTKKVKILVDDIQIVNTKNRIELENPYESFEKPSEELLYWVYTRRKSNRQNPHKLEYKVSPHNEEYSKLSLSIVVDY